MHCGSSKTQTTPKKCKGTLEGSCLFLLQKEVLGLCLVPSFSFHLLALSYHHTLMLESLCYLESTGDKSWKIHVWKPPQLYRAVCLMNLIHIYSFLMYLKTKAKKDVWHTISSELTTPFLRKTDISEQCVRWVPRRTVLKIYRVSHISLIYHETNYDSKSLAII